MTDDEMIRGIRDPGRFDAVVESESKALRLMLEALPQIVELPRAVAGRPYASPAAGVLCWCQLHPEEPQVGNELPHLKYANWIVGKKGRGGSWGHLYFPPSEDETVE